MNKHVHTAAAVISVQIDAGAKCAQGALISALVELIVGGIVCAS